jgi:hypothetical protein
MASPADYPPWRQEGSKINKWPFCQRLPCPHTGLQRGRGQVEIWCSDNGVLVSRLLGALTLGSCPL